MIELSGCGIVPGVTRAQAVDSDRELPPEADAVVIGGGLLGVISALNLSERGVSTVLCEKGVVAGEASGRAAGMLYGLTMAAAAGEALADMVTGEAPKFDISPYRYERFADGSGFVFHP